MTIDLDVIIDADPAKPPFGEHIGLDRQGLEHRPVELFEELAPCHAEPPDRPLLVKPDQEFADGRIQLRQAVEVPVAQASDHPTLHEQHAQFNLCLIPRAARPCRQDGGVVMRRHLGIGSVDLRLVEARLDDGHLRVVRNNQPGNPADRLECLRMCADPIGQPLRPGRLRIGEVRGAEDSDEDPGLSDLAGQSVDHHGRLSPA